jgi:hypothetical protein
MQSIIASKTINKWLILYKNVMCANLIECV